MHPYTRRHHALNHYQSRSITSKLKTLPSSRMFKPPLGDVCCAVCTLIWWWSHDSKVCEWYDQYIQFRRISVGFLPCILHCIQFTCSSCPLSGRAVQPYLVHAARPWPHGWPASAAENVDAGDAGGSGLESWLEIFRIENNRTWQDWTAKGWKQYETIQVNTIFSPCPVFWPPAGRGFRGCGGGRRPQCRSATESAVSLTTGDTMRHDATWCYMMRPNVTDVKTTGLACIMIESYETCETCKLATKSCWYNDMDLSWTAFQSASAPLPEFGSRTLMLQVNRITDLSVMHLSSGWAVAISRERLNMFFMLQHIIKIYIYISRGSKELSRSYFLNGNLFGSVTWL